MLGYIKQPWSNLRGLSNSYAAKSTVLIPLIGYMILFNDSLAHMFDLAKELGGGRAGGGISPRLFWIYFGFCFVAAASIIYALFCPRELKAFGSVEAFTEGVTDRIPPKAYEAMTRTMMGTPFADASAGAARASARLTEQRVALLHVYFEYLDASEPLARSACTVCYALGIGCLGVPATDAFVRIAVLLFKRMFL